MLVKACLVDLHQHKKLPAVCFANKPDLRLSAMPVDLNHLLHRSVHPDRTGRPEPFHYHSSAAKYYAMGDDACSGYTGFVDVSH
jgi:hypothetical protein